MIGITLAGLFLVLHLETAGVGSPVWPVGLLIVGSNGIIAILLPYAAESVPLGVRGKATGWIAACSKGGGLLAQSLSIAGHVPAMGVVAGVIMVPAAASVILVAVFGRETRGLDLRNLESA
jgi:putative MFS transporter